MDAAIFDMDGLLIDSEPAWRRAEIEVFGEVGLALTDAECRETTGLRIDEVAAFHFARAPWEGASPAEVATRIVDLMVARVSAEGAPMDGAIEAVESLAGRTRLALASSSPRRLIDATLARLGLTDRFAVITSAEADRYGKPHPAVFLRAAEALGVAPTRCLVLEDSLNGLVAAKAARMRCVVVPEAPDPRFALADRVLGSLRELPAHLDALLGP